MASASDPATDIVLITVDSLQYDYVSDGPGPATNLPGISRLAEGGSFFSNAFSSASITKASFLSIFSGTHPWMFGSILGGYDDERPHIAELLSGAGYRTAGFNTNPYLSTTYNYDRGFDYYMGRDTDEAVDRTTLSSKYWPVIKEALPSKRLSRLVRSTYGTVGERLGVQLGGDPYVPADAVNEAVLDWLDATTGPRFLWIHYMDVHTPYYPREGTVSENIDKRTAIRLFHHVHKQGADASEKDLRLLERLYRGEVQHFDDRLDELLDGLGARLDLEDSLVVFGSDHGEAFGAHDAIFHPDGVLYDEQIHVPLVVNGPGFDAGTVSTPVSNVDILPTVLAGAGAEVPPVCEGEDLSGIVAAPPEERLVFAQGHDPDTGIAMVASASHKLIRDLEDGTEVLYDRLRDPDETVDRFDDHPRIAENMGAVLDDYLARIRTHDIEAEEIDVSEDVKTRLKMLGYDEQ